MSLIDNILGQFDLLKRVPVLLAPRFYADDVLLSCLSGYRISAASGDPPETVARIQRALADLGYTLTVNGTFDSDTGSALSAYKTAKGMVTNDATVDGATMTALDADFAYELFDAKAADLSGTRFDLGARTGTRNDIQDGLAICAFENGMCMELGHIVAFAMTTTVADAWNEAGAQTGTFGLPINDPLDIDGTRAVHEFELAAFLFGGASNFSLPRPVWEASLAGRGMVGAPVAPPQPIAGGVGQITPHDQGVVLDVPNALPRPLTQAVFDLWAAQANAGTSLGAPTGFAFPSSSASGSTVYPFAAGSIVLDASGVASVGSPVNADLQRYFLPIDNTQRLLSRLAGEKATPLVGADIALAAMQADIALATGPNDFIYMLNWHCNVDLQLVTGKAATTLRSMLSAAVVAGVQIRGMFWAGLDPPHPPLVVQAAAATLVLAYEVVSAFATTLVANRAMNTTAVQFINGLSGDAAAVLDDRHRVFGSHHQKILVLLINDNLIAYIGGVEYNADRLLSLPSEPGSPLFDMSVRLEGGGAWQALDTFVGRWQAQPSQPGAPLRGASLPIPLPAGGPLAIQLTHTYGQGYPYTTAVQTARTALANGISNARQFFYMEDQYFVGSPQMDAAFRDVLTRNPSVIGIIVIAAEDSVSDLPDLPFRRRNFLAPIAATFPGRFLIFERLGGGSTTGPTAYVHSKLLIVDDEAAFIGSVNSSRRSWFHDSEVDGTIVDTTGAGGIAPGSRGWVRDFRCTIWSRHFNQPASSLGEPTADLAIWQGINAATVAGSSVRPYNVFTVVPRFSYKGHSISTQTLTEAWDTVEDPA